MEKAIEAAVAAAASERENALAAAEEARMAAVASAEETMATKLAAAEAAHAAALQEAQMQASAAMASAAAEAAADRAAALEAAAAAALAAQSEAVAHAVVQAVAQAVTQAAEAAEEARAARDAAVATTRDEMSVEKAVAVAAVAARVAVAESEARAAMVALDDVEAEYTERLAGVQRRQHARRRAWCTWVDATCHAHQAHSLQTTGRGFAQGRQLARCFATWYLDSRACMACEELGTWHVQGRLGTAMVMWRRAYADASLRTLARLCGAMAQLGRAFDRLLARAIARCAHARYTLHDSLAPSVVSTRLIAPSAVMPPPPEPPRQALTDPPPPHYERAASYSARIRLAMLRTTTPYGYARRNRPDVLRLAVERLSKCRDCFACKARADSRAAVGNAALPLRPLHSQPPPPLRPPAGCPRVLLRPGSVPARPSRPMAMAWADERRADLYRV